MSYSKDPKPAALELKALAACKIGNKAKAKSASDALDRETKKRVRKQCRDMGVRIGL